jgi:hypothetical protein
MRPNLKLPSMAQSQVLRLELEEKIPARPNQPMPKRIRNSTEDSGFGARRIFFTLK